MRDVPELVFVNCCHLAARDAAVACSRRTTAPQFAASDRRGADRDRRALRHRRRLGGRGRSRPRYSRPRSTRRCSAATASSTPSPQRAAPPGAPGGNTWAAYQCYGDPDWTWRRDGADAQRAAAGPSDEFAGVSSPPALTLALETISIRLRFGGDDPKRRQGVEQAQRDKIRYLEAKFAPLWGRMGAVAEAFGLAYADARDRQGDRVVPRRARRRRRQRLVPGRRAARQPAGAARRGARRPRRGPAATSRKRSRAWPSWSRSSRPPNARRCSARRTSGW